ncbi:MAG: PDZ domain-containing protein [Tepidisphaeraceae bacterium]
MLSARPIFCLAVLALAGLGVDAATTEKVDAKTDTKPEKVAYLGVATSVVTPALAAQLGLPAGVGVTVDAVDANSPALQAGVQVHDVITKFDEQVVVNVQQFAVLVRLHKKGDAVPMQLVRQGKQTTLTAKLGERLLPPIDLATRLPLPPHGGRISSVIQHVDTEHNITVTTQIDGTRQVRITNPAGEVLYDGPLNTPDDKSKLPADCLKKIDTIQRNFDRYQKLRGTTQPAK